MRLRPGDLIGHSRAFSCVVEECSGDNCYVMFGTVMLEDEC